MYTSYTVFKLELKFTFNFKSIEKIIKQNARSLVTKKKKKIYKTLKKNKKTVKYFSLLLSKLINPCYFDAHMRLI